PSTSVFAGTNSLCNVVITPLNGFSSNVTFSLTGLPAKTSASFSPTSVAGSGSSILTITASNNVLPGDYTLTVTGTSGDLSVSAPLFLTVTEPPPSGDTQVIAADNAWVRRSENTT